MIQEIYKKLLQWPCEFYYARFTLIPKLFHLKLSLYLVSRIMRVLLEDALAD